MAQSALAQVAAHTRRSFPQARARATYQALLAAARDVFARRGYDETQSPDIAAAAGVSVGTFYRYFTDKRQAFVEMIAAHLEEAQRDVLAQLQPERLGGGERRATIDTAIEVLFRHAGRFPALENVFMAMALRDPEVARLKAEWDDAACAALAALIEAIVPREVVRDPRAAAFVVHRAALEVATARAVRNEGRNLDERQVRIALREMMERYFFPGPAVARRARATRKK
jgi:AcrR family transcriptional regulator